MATSLTVEEESGTCSSRTPVHNGYYAGDFSSSAGEPGRCDVSFPPPQLLA